MGRAGWNWAIAMSPWQAVHEAARPRFANAVAANSFALADPVVHLPRRFSLVSILLNAVAIAMVRVWNPPREAASAERPRKTTTRSSGNVKRAITRSTDVHGAGGKVRTVWDNPILWREVRTWAYGKRILLIRLAYWAVFLACAAVSCSSASTGVRFVRRRAIPAAAKPLVALLVRGADSAQRAGRHVADQRAR